MKIINMMLLLAGVALLAGCASLAEPQNRPDEQWNSAYIQAVEQAARNEPRGLDVIWVRPPVVKQESEDSDN